MNGDGRIFDCIVLGAGIAGVTAARDLRQAGLEVLVLEGSARIGGRMYTRRDFVRHPDHRADRFPIEAGAEYVHVVDRSRYPEFLGELARQGFRLRKLPKFLRNRLAFPRWRRNPKKLPTALLRSTSLIPTLALLADVDAYDRAEDIAAGAYVAGKGYQGKGFSLARYTMSAHTPGELFDAAHEPAFPGTPADPVDTISVAGFRSDQLPKQLFYELSEWRMERDAGGERRIPGYDSLPRAIADELRDPAGHGARPGEILFEQVVEDVSRSADRGEVRVRTRDAAGGVQTFRARSAVCTFSVGMLDPVSGEGDRIFGDLLTGAKRQALRSVVMGPITKLSLEFKRGVWGRKSLMTVMSHPRSGARTFFSAFPSTDDATSGERGPFVLTGLLMNQDHRIVHGLDDHAAAQHLLDELQRVLDRRGPRWTPETMLVERAPGVPNFQRQDWENDRFAKGGNSFIRFRPDVDSAAVGRLRGALRDARETVPLFWAGEATAPAFNPLYQPLAVHGAYISGVEVAKDVVAFLRQAPSDEAFARFFAAERAPAVRDAETEHRLDVRLTATDQAAAAEAGRQHKGGGARAGARHLCRLGIFLQDRRPRTPLAPAPETADAAAVEMRFTDAEWRRVVAYAERDFDGDREAAARALIHRGAAERP